MVHLLMFAGIILPLSPWYGPSKQPACQSVFVRGKVPLGQEPDVTDALRGARIDAK
jgi:hypothetical protein